MATSNFIAVLIAAACGLAAMFRLSSDASRWMTWRRMRRLGLVASIAAAVAVAPALGPAATGVLALALMRMPRADEVFKAVTIPRQIVLQSYGVHPTRTEEARYVELDNGRGVVVFRVVNGLMSTRLKLYRQAA